MKLLLEKQLKTYRLNYEQMQPVLQEIETIVNNQLLTYVYPTELETCITSNHLLFGRTLSFSNLEPAPRKLYSSKLSNIINYLWDRWRKEYITSLVLSTINIGDMVIGIMEDVIKGSDGHRGAVVRIPKSILS